jgi:uncharacterized damage-inducible protein DinB
MPAAHALVQARSDITAAIAPLDDTSLWIRPGGAASVGFHLAHIPGSIDRLLTYASGTQNLGDQQRAALDREKALSDAKPGHPGLPSVQALAAGVDEAIEKALTAIRRTDPRTLTEQRLVGRAGLPSTVAGLLFHIAEHTQRHTGQIIATAKAVRAR